MKSTQSEKSSGLLTTFQAHLRVSVALMIPFAAFAQLPNGKPDLTGVWQLDSTASKMNAGTPDHKTWNIHQTDDKIQLSRTVGDASKELDVECNTMGRECATKVNGETGKVTFYYNGNTLVEFEVVGKNGEKTIKRRMTMAPDGHSLEVEVLHFAPKQNTETLVYRKNPTDQQASSGETKTASQVK